jgi:hypothetical protein
MALPVKRYEISELFTHPTKKIKILGAILELHQLDSTANSAHLPPKWAKLAKLAVLFSWYLQNGPQDFNFFNHPGCRIFI